MGEHTSGAIAIGGRIAKSDLPSLCQAIRDQGVATNWCGPAFLPGDEHTDPEFCAQKLLKALDDTGHLFLCDEQATYGMFTDLERTLRQLNLAYDRLSDPCEDTGYRMVKYRPDRKQLYRFDSDADGQPVVPQRAIRSILLTLTKTIEPRRDEDAATTRSFLKRTLQGVCDDLTTVAQLQIPPLPRFEILPGGA